MNVVKKKLIPHKNNYANQVEVITIPVKTFTKAYDYILLWQQQHHKPFGLFKDAIPKAYIKKTFEKGISLALIEVFLSCNYYNELIALLRKARSLIHSSFEPIVNINPGKQLLTLTINPVNNCISCELKNTPKKIKYPVRKKYRDLDKQAESLIEKENKEKLMYKPSIDNGDWVKFKVTVLEERVCPVMGTKEYSPLIPTCGFYWLKVSKEPTDAELYALFALKKKNETFITYSKFLNQIIQPSRFCNFALEVSIIEHIPHNFFCFEKFKNFFSCRSTEEIVTRIIDVLSLRQDIPLRTEITQMVMKSLLECYKVSLSDDILEIFQQNIRETIIYNPDYIIYQSKNDFDKNIRSIAYKTAIETALIDYLISNEKITLTENDVYLFLNILQRPRFRHFHHFNNATLRHRTRELPIPEEIINQYVLREKTVQHFVKILAK